MPRLLARYEWKTVVLTMRQRRSKTQGEFAASVGCSVFSVSKWECGGTAPTAKHRRLLERFGAEAGYPVSDWPEASEQISSFERVR